MNLKTMIRNLLGADQPQNSILVLIDFDNMYINLDLAKTSVRMAFQRILEYFSSVGNVAGVFVFGPPNNILSNLNEIWKWDFVPIPCLLVKDKHDPTKDNDTVDERMIRFGLNMLPSMPGVNIVGLVTGDIHFHPLVSRIKQMRKRVAIAVSKIDPLNKELIDTIDRDPRTGKKMFFLIQQEPS